MNGNLIKLDTSMIGGEEEKVIRKKRKSTKRISNNPKFIPAIRILRRDIRRKYGEMLMNVLNCCDLDLHRKFLNEFAVPHLSQHFLVFPPEMLARFHFSPQFQGIEAMIESFRRQYMVTPDITFQLSEVQIYKRLNTPGSRIVAKSYVRGTILYSLIPSEQLVEDVQTRTNVISVDKISSHGRRDISESKKEFFLQALDQQLDYCVDGFLTISLDDQHRFVSVEVTAFPV